MKKSHCVCGHILREHNDTFGCCHNKERCVCKSYEPETKLRLDKVRT